MTTTSSTEKLRHALAERTLVLDGANGTELERRGVPTPAPLWSAAALRSHPAVIREIHREYLAAGADIIVANTFRTNPRALRAAGCEADGAELSRLAVELARGACEEQRIEGSKDQSGDGNQDRRNAGAEERRGKAKDRRDEVTTIKSQWVAASVGPVEDCYRPDLVPDEGALTREHEQNAEWLAMAGPDLAWVETINTVREAAAAGEVYSRMGLPWVICFVTDERGRLLSGEPLAEAVAAADRFEPAAIGLNCVPPRGLTANLARLRGMTNRPLAAYAHIGNTAPLRGWSFAEQLDTREYAAEARKWLDCGARIVGGCCGTTPGHVAALRALVDAIKTG